LNSSDKGNTSYLYTVSIVAAIGGLLFGFDAGVISGAIPYVTKYFDMNVHQEGFTVSILIIGCIIGASAAGALSDRFGRKKILIVLALFFVLSAILSAVPQTHLELIIARFIGGLAVGASSVLSPMYISEISPAQIRGRLVSLNQFTIVTGILVTYFSNWLLVDIGPNNWRWMFGVEAIPAGIFLFLLFLVPESPRWLAKQGMHDNALAILAKISGRKHAEVEMDEIVTSLKEEEGSFRELLQPGLRKILVVAVLLGFFSQICGIDAVIYYAPKIFLWSGYESASSAFLASVVVAVINFLFTIIALLYVDKFGRKPLLLFGLIGMTISFILAGYALQSATTRTHLVLIPILSYIAFFAISLGPIPWIFISEVFPNKIRGRAVSIATMALWISNFIIAQSFPWMVETIGGGSFYIFSLVCFLTFIFVLFMITETKGKTLEEIEQMWKR
jgi:SP family arabinose:H+ symporter-like MFS transporter